ncbi:type II toxin-antitoxin system RelE/ParE family toxin [Gordonia caeni]|uniref:Plasmid maintenance system killer protein n=1 Tax=Gordonia caeni TaxID=1007097 RepID=A0ABP7PIE2_9ACTN
MELRYQNNELERRCTDARYMQRKLGVQKSKTLRLRLNELRSADDISDLLVFAGKWEELKGDRAGQWSGRLTGNWRLIVKPDDGAITVLVIEIVDYHKR